MNSLKRVTTRGIAVGVASALVGSLAAMVVTASPAQAAPKPAAGDLEWGVSEHFVEHLYYSKMGPVLPTTPTGTVSGGASHAAGDPADGADDLFTFPAATVDQVGGKTVATYVGTVRGAFVVGGNEQYNVTIANPIVTTDASGAGKLEATVSSSNVGSSRAPAASTKPTRVTVAEFSEGALVDGTLETTPNWEGVLAPGSEEAVALGITDPDRPVDGKSFAPSFLAGLVPGVRAHFYFSSSGDHKRPTPIKAGLDTSRITPKVVAANKALGIDLDVSAVDFPAGDNGAYVILAPADTVIDPDNRDEGMNLAAAVTWLQTSDIRNGSFKTVLRAQPNRVVRGTQYAVFTIPAHGDENPEQMSRTLVDINWAAYAEKLGSKTVVKLKKKPTTKKKGKAVITVKGVEGVKPSGKVKVTLKKGKQTKKVNGKLNKSGKATLKLPKLKKGKWKLVAKYTGDVNFNKSKKTVKFKVKK